ncbi:AGE family epimerase/isomerase [Vibrio sp. SCSIO 43136]|uniref:AGE family epimerase/isomerase n=1 Tax=Vibrio sp. SCSIO 43136 TaxID=2819101 RepID=UPI00207598F7|nr:AGE family epimerase/isomerase [Vibrio sp. SCSIO 43136]USD67401.1 AGE family epimerase/isomerase [Vibrio sp. SCSIO 43136]
MSELHQFKSQLKLEAQQILDFWSELQDQDRGGFYCFADFEGNVDKEHPKSVLLHSRILWTFSNAYRVLGDEKYKQAADHCYHFMTAYALDAEFGGVYWMLDKNGNVTDTQKHVYNQGFAIYAFSEYFLATGHLSALEHAKVLFELVEKHAFDHGYGGYHEAFDRQWSPIANHLVCDTAEGVLAEKSMNTHLHIMEAYTTLHQAWPDLHVQQQLKGLCELMIEKVVDSSLHFGLFFSRDWKCVSRDVSYGHDIEGTWLMDAAAGQLEDRTLANAIFELTSEMAQVTYDQGMEKDGAIFNELREGHLLDSDRIWWVQAEAMVGFFNAYQKSLKAEQFSAAQGCWNIIQTELKDGRFGEWYWKVNRQGQPYTSEAKVEPWKCPYHNGRACLEVYQRIAPLEQDDQITFTAPITH